MYEKINECTNEARMNECIYKLIRLIRKNEWMNECMNAWMNKCIKEWMYARMNVCKNECMQEWMNNWMNPWTKLVLMNAIMN